ncbi:hypothetical protein [Microvirga massiliensis]|uniref:hypothetical protein n=1 Tax=Microvirga massiliensis TaxID=1033741 RepID=UPI0006603A8C|nr:hypothetical protein [Microvirga massiliensis]
MAQRSNAKAAAHRQRQADYRARLREARAPESDDVQREVFRVIRQAAFRLRKDRDKCKLPHDPHYRRFVEDFLQRVFDTVLDRLERKGYDREKARRRLSLALIPPWPGR